MLSRQNHMNTRFTRYIDSPTCILNFARLCHVTSKPKLTRSLPTIQPGGEQSILEFAGKDATKMFYSLHRHEVLEKRLKRLKVGEIKGFDKKDSPQNWSQLSAVPYAEIDMDNSPYYNDSHKRFRMVVRNVLWEEGIYEWSDAAEMSGEYPSKEIMKKHGKWGFLALFAGRGAHLKGVPEPNLWSEAGIKSEDIDQFHLGIMGEERSRMVCPGAEDGVASGVSIGIGPVIHYGQEWAKREVVPRVLSGDAVICLAITEPYAGSDVAGIKTTATQATVNGEEGFLVSGQKKWITNSCFADYYTTLVLTKSKDGKDLGYSMLLMEKCDQIIVKPIPTDYSMSAGTGLMIIENAFVPARNLLGQIGMGFQITMTNFNLERLGIVTVVVSRARRIIEETFLWCNQREAFGKKLLDQPVVRNMLGQMIADYESVYSNYEKLMFQYQTLSRKDANAKLGGPTGLLKYRATRMMTNVSDKATQLVGGRSVTRTGMGKSVQRNQKSFKLASIYGGSEEICVDLGVRQAMKQFPKNAKL